MDLKKLKWLDRLLALLLILTPRSRLVDPAVLPESILIVKLSAMGDALWLMPSIKSLTKALPGAKIDWLTTYRTNPELFEHLSFIHRIIVLPTTMFGLMTFLVKRIRDLLRYDLIIDADQYYQISELISKMGKYSAGFGTPLKGKTFSVRHAYVVERNEKLQFRDLFSTTLKSFDLELPASDWRSTDLLGNHKPPDQLRALTQEFHRLDKKILVLYPGSGQNAAFRRWPWSNFEQIIQRTSERAEIVIAGGPDELALRQKVDCMNHRIYNWIGKWSLLDWAWFLNDLHPVIVANDGGFLHLAEAVGVPTLSIFGPSKGSKAGSIHRESIALEANLDCRPCIKNYLGEVPSSCWKGTSECLKMITPDKVLAELESKI